MILRYIVVLIVNMIKCDEVFEFFEFSNKFFKNLILL